MSSNTNVEVCIVHTQNLNISMHPYMLIDSLFMQIIYPIFNIVIATLKGLLHLGSKLKATYTQIISS